MVAVMMEPIKELDSSNPSNPKSHPPKKPPTKPNMMFHTTPSDLDFIIFPARKPAIPPTIKDTIQLILRYI